MFQGVALALTGGVVAHQTWRHPRLRRRVERSTVAILRCADYSLAPKVVDDGLRLLAPAVRGKRVLLKPNLVEYSPRASINTHPMVIASAADSLYRLGAAAVIVADGPGHVRDADQLLHECGLAAQLAAVGRVRFVDLNFDSVRRIPLAGFTSLGELWLPETVLGADVVISMPKVKTHHWTGVTLSLKNLFGIVPGGVYGWPKNVLHWQGIENSIVELAAAVSIHYVIADGIEAMEGNGPLHGSSRHLGCLVFADDPVAADATCCRMMCIPPERVRHVALASPLGCLDAEDIDECGEDLDSLRKCFERPPWKVERAEHNP
jgi:uncharacterized protein (DUF362 family)